MKIKKRRSMSKETKTKISDSLKGKIPWNKGKSLSKKVRKKMSIAKTGENHSQWKGGKIKDGHGGILIYSPNHPNSNSRNYVREHRLIMEKHLGRDLKKSEVVHHIDENRENNKLSNLMLFPNQKAHAYFHYQLKRRENTWMKKSKVRK